MRKYFINVLMFISIHATALAQDASSVSGVEFDVKYLEKLELKASAVKSKDSISVDVSSLEDDNYEVKVSVNRYFKPFVIIGARVTEFLDSFDLSDIGKGFGANIQFSDSVRYYAKYVSGSISDDKLLRFNSSSMHVGVEYSF